MLHNKQKYKIATVLFLIIVHVFVFSVPVFAQSTDVEYKPFIWKTEVEYMHWIYVELTAVWSNSGINDRTYWTDDHNIQDSRKILDPENHFREKLRPQLATPTGFPLVYSIIEYYGYTEEELRHIIEENKVYQYVGYLEESNTYPVNIRGSMIEPPPEQTLVPLLSDYFIDVLYSGNEPLIKLTFKSPAVLYDFSSNRLYDFYDLSAMSNDELSKITVDYTDLQQWNVVMKAERYPISGPKSFSTEDTSRAEDCSRISSKVRIIDYRNEEYAPQTGTPIVPLAITAAAALVMTVVIQKRKRVKYTR